MKSDIKRVNFTIAGFLLEELDYMAKKKGMNRSQFLAMVISNEFMNFQRNGYVTEDYYKAQALKASEQIIYDCSDDVPFPDVERGTGLINY